MRLMDGGCQEELGSVMNRSSSAAQSTNPIMWHDERLCKNVKKKIIQREERRKFEEIAAIVITGTTLKRNSYWRKYGLYRSLNLWGIFVKFSQVV